MPTVRPGRSASGFSGRTCCATSTRCCGPSTPSSPTTRRSSSTSRWSGVRWCSTPPTSPTTPRCAATTCRSTSSPAAAPSPPGPTTLDHLDEALDEGRGRTGPPPRPAPAPGVLRRPRRPRRRAGARRDPGADVDRTLECRHHCRPAGRRRSPLSYDRTPPRCRSTSRPALRWSGGGPASRPTTDRSPCWRPAGATARWPCRPTPTGCSCPTDHPGSTSSRSRWRSATSSSTRPCASTPAASSSRCGAPLDDDERGAAAQKSLEREYRRGIARGRGRRLPGELPRTIGGLQPPRHRPRPGRDAAVDASVLERRRRVGAGARRIGAADRGQPGVVARPRVRPRPDRQRLAAQALPQARPPARPADVARLDAQAPGPRPSRRRPAHQDRGHPRGPTLGRPARPERLQRRAPRLGVRVPRTGVGGGLPAQRRPRRPEPGRRRPRPAGPRRRETHRALRTHLARGPHRDGRPPRRGRVRPRPRPRPRAPRARPQQHLGARPRPCRARPDRRHRLSRRLRPACWWPTCWSPTTPR